MLLDAKKKKNGLRVPLIVSLDFLGKEIVFVRWELLPG